MIIILLQKSRKLSIENLLNSLDEEIGIIYSSDFKIEITETKYVPNFDDSNLAYENFDTKKKKVKTIETCVLFIDIRKSTSLNLKHYPQTMAKLYSSFIRSMIKAAEYYDGKIRNIIGDRIMVVFDSEQCFTNAVNTAILMNTISQKIINEKFKNNSFTCGIGIDYGKMMVTKCGTIKQGHENANYKSLVWLGRPANIASKLTDEANKNSTSSIKEILKVGFHYPNIDKLHWQEQTINEFEKNIIFSYITPNMIYKDENFSTFFGTTKTESNYDSTPPILMTETVYNGYKKENPDNESINKNWWSKKNRKISDYDGIVYGGDVIKIWEK
jgi:adenylate cyclase